MQLLHFWSAPIWGVSQPCPANSSCNSRTNVCRIPLNLTPYPTSFSRGTRDTWYRSSYHYFSSLSNMPFWVGGCSREFPTFLLFASFLLMRMAITSSCSVQEPVLGVVWCGDWSKSYFIPCACTPSVPEKEFQTKFLMGCPWFFFCRGRYTFYILDGPAILRYSIKSAWYIWQSGL